MRTESSYTTIGQVGEEELPKDGRHQNALLSLILEDREVVDARYDAEGTNERLEKAQSQFDRLSSRPPTDENDDE